MCAQKYPTKDYTLPEIQELLDNYIMVPIENWNSIPSGSHIRYIKKGEESVGMRFKPGGYVKAVYNNNESEKCLSVENIKGGSVSNPNYRTFRILFSATLEIWKKIDINSNIEFSLLSQEVKKLQKRIAALEKR